MRGTVDTTFGRMVPRTSCTDAPPKTSTVKNQTDRGQITTAVLLTQSFFKTLTMHTKELLTVEFRYMDVPYSEHFSGYKTKEITIGIFDTLEEAVNAGNETLKVLATKFQVKEQFAVKGPLWGMPTRLVTNTCSSKDRIQYFAKITTLSFNSLEETINETFEADKRYQVHMDHKEND